MRKKLIIALLIIVAIITICNYIVINKSKDYVFDTVEEVPKSKVVLVLGTSKKTSDGRNNLYFIHRITAAIELYNAGKIEKIIVSGDNSNKNYNEPEDMKNALIEKGIPEDKIIMDFAGLRTLDSVIRTKEIFGQDSFIVISQKFHNERAIYLARHYNVEAYGYNAKDVSRAGGFKTKAREKLARVKLFIDLLFNKAPKFMGEKINI